MIKPWTLAIDFGTTSTVTVIGVEGERPHVLEVGGERRVPSTVYIDDDGSVLVGQVAAGLAMSDPARGIRGLKGRLGNPAPIVLAGQAHRAVDLVAEVLRFSLNEAVRHQGSAPSHTRLTYPATWSRPRRAQLLEAARLAGLPDPSLIAEPVAAALTYAETVGIPDGSHVAVFDLGGGTFDTAVLLRSGADFKVIGKPTGDPELGGELFDEIIMNEIGERLSPERWDAMMTSDEMPWRQSASRLRAECKRVKEAVSSHAYGEMVIGTPDGLSQQRLTREEVEGLLEPHIDEAIHLLRRCVSDAAVPTSALSAIFVAGGAARMPLIERKLREAYPTVQLGLQGDPKASVAYGALIATPGTLDVGLNPRPQTTTTPLAAPLPPRQPANPTADTALPPTPAPTTPTAPAVSTAVSAPAAASPGAPTAVPATAVAPPTPAVATLGGPTHGAPTATPPIPATQTGAGPTGAVNAGASGAGSNRGPIIAALAGVTALVGLVIGFIVLGGGEGTNTTTDQTTSGGSIVETGDPENESTDDTADPDPDSNGATTTTAGDVITVGADGEYATLTEALSAAPAGANLSLSAETFTLVDTVVVDRDITITGAGASSTIITTNGEMDGAVMQFNDVSVGLIGVSVTYTGSGPTNVLEFDNADIDLVDVIVSGARFDTNNPTFAGSGNGIAALGTTSGTMESVVSTDNEIGIGLHGRTSVEVTLSVTSDNRDHGFGFFDTTSSTASSNTSSANGISGFAVFNTASPSLIGNTSSENESAGFVWFDASAGIGRDNTADANLVNGFELQSTSSPDLTANLASNNGADGFRWSGEARGLATGNEANANLSDGFVTVGTSSPTLSSNLSTANTVDGFAFASESAPIVTSNTSTDNTEAGFSWLDTAAGTARDNTATGNVIAGFYMGSSAAPSLTDNTSENNPGTGFLWTNEATGTAEGNEAIGNTLNGFEVQGTAGPVLTGNTSNDNLGLGFGWFQKAVGSASGNSASGNEGDASFVAASATPELGDNEF